MLDKKKEQLISAMEIAGYYFDDIESYDGCLRFNTEYNAVTFIDWQEVKDWLNGVVFDNPEISDAVEKTLHPERFNRK